MKLNFMRKNIEKLNRSELLGIILGNYKFFQREWFHQKYLKFYINSISNKELFTLIYKKNLWGEQQSLSGTGSTIEATQNIRKELKKIIRKYNIKSILDIPCGDFNWMQKVDLYGIKYIGADIVDELVEINEKRFSDKTHSFKILDIVNDDLPECDLVLCRDCLVHLSKEDILSVIQNIKRSRSKYILTTTFPQHLINAKLGIDYWRPINLEVAPYSFPKPVLMIQENCEESGYEDKKLGMWVIQDL